jgi:hypothetical protein
MSPLKLLNKNKDGIRYVDFFIERMSRSTRKVASKSWGGISVQRDEPTQETQAEKWARFMSNFPVDLEPLKVDFEKYFKGDFGDDELIEKITGFLKENGEINSKVDWFLQNLKPSQRTDEAARRYKANYIVGKYAIPLKELGA